MKKFIPQKIKNIYHLGRSYFSAVWFGFPAKNLKVIGVTGTNGKTTTTLMIGKILEEAGKKIAVASTINFKIGKEEWVNKTKFTTLSGWHLQKFIFKAKEADCDYLVLEVGSHALDQNRVWGIEFDIAVITNITREHLDYHRTMEKYRKAKRKLFESLRGGFFNWKIHRGNFFLRKKKNKKIAVVNLAMESPEDFLKVRADEKYGYLAEISDNKGSQFLEKGEKENFEYKKVFAKNVQSGMWGSHFELLVESSKGREENKNSTKFEIYLPGHFNIENALASICVGLSQNINLQTCANALKKIEKIAGRMDYIQNKRGIDIIIDYALTPDSMEKVGKLMRDNLSEKKGIERPRLIWVFGACGERDRGKRPIMGEIVSKYADMMIVTNEDPYEEDQEQIIDEVLSGIIENRHIEDGESFDLQTSQNIQGGQDKTKDGFGKEITRKLIRKKVWKIIDRKKAIQKALDLAKKGDVILITGKGAEETMAIGEKRIPWNDRMAVEEILKEEKDWEI